MEGVNWKSEGGKTPTPQVQLCINKYLQPFSIFIVNRHRNFDKRIKQYLVTNKRLLNEHKPRVCACAVGHLVQISPGSPQQSSLSGKESAQGCVPQRLLGRPD